MNIFVLGLVPGDAARHHCNKHVVKMILESAQLLCTAKSMCDNGGEQLCPVSLGVAKTYRNVHKNHPCALAVRRSRAAFLWVADLALCLCVRYTEIYGKVHASEPLIRALAAASLENPTGEPFLPKTVVATLLTRRGPIELPLCMPPECFCYDADGKPNAILSYRQYYIAEKAAFARWKERHQPPKWFLRGIRRQKCGGPR